MSVLTHKAIRVFNKVILDKATYKALIDEIVIQKKLLVKKDKRINELMRSKKRK